MRWNSSFAFASAAIATAATRLKRDHGFIEDRSEFREILHLSVVLQLASLIHRRRHGRDRGRENRRADSQHRDEDRVIWRLAQAAEDR